MMPEEKLFLQEKYFADARSEFLWRRRLAAGFGFVANKKIAGGTPEPRRITFKASH
jgi:hypothetical protein